MYLTGRNCNHTENHVGGSRTRTVRLASTRTWFWVCGADGPDGKKDSLRALSAAWEEGIRLFDTARSYGYGESEALLGRFLKGKRDAAIVATKFGILSAPQGAWKRAAKSAARSLLSIVPPARSLVRRAAATQFSANQFTIPVLQRSIEESLTKLGTDYVDILFMHGAPASVLEQEDLLEAMGQLVDQERCV